ncbi:MAG: phosphoserine phosphatase SerB [Candidatus Endonucleobacter sp. (ex Gigantidas childressi)]|nr:phosphoserine phosphatase SerB [Candidatus Endonucleobacter sp. (ex Gigantidas childressi)]
MSNTALLSVVGSYQDNTMASLLSILVGYDLDVLDITQSLISGYMTIAIVARRAKQSVDMNFLEGVKNSITEYGYLCCCCPLGEHENLSFQKTGFSVLTLMSDTLKTVDLQCIFAAISSIGLAIVNIKKLSNSCYDDQCFDSSACLEIRLSGQSMQLAQLKQKCSVLSDELNLDIVLQMNATNRKNYRLVVFDMDSTLIKAEVIDLLAEAARVGRQVAEITEKTMRGELDFNGSFRQRLAMLKGLDESFLYDISQNLPLMNGVEKLIENLKYLGCKTAIISGGFTYFAKYLQDKLGIDYIYANELDIIKGKVTGQAKEPIINGERKAQILQQLAFHEGLSLDQVIAVGDGANDLPMLSIAGLGIAFHAKPLVKEQASHAISRMGLDSILYVLGLHESDIYSPS